MIVPHTSPTALSIPSIPSIPSTREESVAAQLTARERRVLLEDIGHIALTLGRFLSPPITPPETGIPETSPNLQPIPASPALRSRPGALTSPQERLHFLSALWNEIESALSVIVRHPDSRAVCVPQSMPLARSRGNSGSAASVARSSRTAAAWRQIQTANKQFLDSHSPAQTHFPVSSFPISLAASPVPPEQTPLMERVTTRTCDTWANRLAVSLLTHIEEEATALRRLADFCEARQEAAEADHLATSARRVRVNTFLRDCPRLRDSEQTQAGSGDNIGRCSAPYHAVYRAWRSLTHPLDFDWSGSPLLYLPALEPWHLYEVWCYLQVAAALLQAGWRLTGSDLLRCTPNGLRLGLATGRESRLCFEMRTGNGEQGQETGPAPRNPQCTMRSASLSLYYQPLFASANQTARRERAQQANLEPLRVVGKANKNEDENADKEGSGKKKESREEKDETNAAFAFVSRSHAMQPDIALHYSGQLILLDPKFKRYVEGEDTQDDINKMHTYRDAIVSYSRHSKQAGDSGNSRPFQGRRVSGMQAASPVSAAWCLFPGSRAEDETRDETGAVLHNPLYAYPAATPEAPLGTAEVGAFPLRPGQPDTTDRLAEFITALLTII